MFGSCSVVSALQACTLLLTVLFVYDVFFVFITPFLTNVCQDVKMFFFHMLFRRLLSLLLCVTLTLPMAFFSTEWGEYNGGGRGWSLWLRHTWKGELVYKFHNSPQLTGKVTLMFVFLPASHGAQSAEVKLLSSGPLWPALLSPGLWRHLSTR